MTEDWPSCWGCGHDYTMRWKLDELADSGHLGILAVPAGHKVCPDCIEEVMGIERISNL